MFDLPAFDVAVGLIFLFVTLALVCTTLNEAVASALGLRASFLEQGLLNLLSASPRVTKAGLETAEAFYGHPLVQGLIRPKSEGREPPRRLRGLRKRRGYPSYIPSRTFVAAVLDLARDAEHEVATAKGDEAEKARARVAKAGDDFEKALAAVPNAQLSEALLALYRSVGRDAEAFRYATERWFDDAMERVSGWYKRKVHTILAIIAAIVVVLLNADTLSAGKVLWRDDAVRAAVVQKAENAAKGPLDDAGLEQTVRKLDLPLGWDLSFGDQPTQLPNDGLSWAEKLIGLLLTIGAIQLGAPFWFDLLSKIVRVRATGAPPPATDAVRRGEGEEKRRGDVSPAEVAR